MRRGNLNFTIWIKHIPKTGRGGANPPSSHTTTHAVPQAAVQMLARGCTFGRIPGRSAILASLQSLTYPLADILFRATAFNTSNSIHAVLPATAEPFPPSALTDFSGTMAQTDFCGLSHAFQHGLHLAMRSTQTSPDKVQ